MFMVEVNGMRCLYTGDYSRVTDRHLPAADMPPVTPHIGMGGGVCNHQTACADVMWLTGSVKSCCTATAAVAVAVSRQALNYVLRHMLQQRVHYAVVCSPMISTQQYNVRLNSNTLLLPHLTSYPAVIVESTYGTQLHGPRETRERLFTETIARTVRGGGRVLLPIVAIGRAQVSGRLQGFAFKQWIAAVADCTVDVVLPIVAISRAQVIGSVSGSCNKAARSAALVCCCMAGPACNGCVVWLLRPPCFASST
jgi:hypothetical protein